MSLIAAVVRFASSGESVEIVTEYLNGKLDLTNTVFWEEVMSMPWCSTKRLTRPWR